MPPDAVRLSEEGVVFFPDYFVRKGIVQWEHIHNLFTQGLYPTRGWQENQADLNAALASLRAGEQALQKLVQIHGIGSVLSYMDRLGEYARKQMVSAISRLQAGRYQAEEFLDDGSRLAVCWEIKDESIIVDFTGTSATHPGNLNANQAIVNSAVLYVLRLLLAEDLPLNEGLLEVVDQVIPSGMLNPSFVQDPDHCPAVVGGNVETSQRLVDTLLKALGIVGCSQGTMNNLLMGNDRFGYYETIGGGTGAGRGFDGADAVHQHMTNTRITDPEVLEFRYPVQLNKFGVRRGSGGNGRWKGGNGIIRDIQVLEPIVMTILSQHRVHAPYGMAGGEAGRVGRQYVIRKDGEIEELQGVDGCELLPGDRIVVETPGGGGFGKI